MSGRLQAVSEADSPRRHCVSDVLTDKKSSDIRGHVHQPAGLEVWCDQLRHLCVERKLTPEDGRNSTSESLRGRQISEVGRQVEGPYASPVSSPLFPVQPGCSPLQPAPGSESSCWLHLLSRHTWHPCWEHIFVY